MRRSPSPGMARVTRARCKRAWIEIGGQRARIVQHSTSFEITAIFMDGISVAEAPRLKRGSVRYASAPSTARTGDIDYDASLDILRGSGWEPPLEPVELRPLLAFSGQGGAMKREALP